MGKRKESAAVADQQAPTDRTHGSKKSKPPEAIDLSTTFITSAPSQLNEDIKDVTTPKN